MRNPFRTEAEAYRFVLGTVVYFGAIAIATAVGGRWWGIGVFVVLSAVVVSWFFRREARPRPSAAAPPHRGAEDERRILVVANETVAGAALEEAIRSAAEGAHANVLVVSPALNTPLKHWASDDDEARASADDRLARSIGALEQLGFQARGEIGDADPLQAIEDALRTFGADLIIISTHPEDRANWLERGVVSGARSRFAVPVAHVVSEPEAGSGPAG